MSRRFSARHLVLLSGFLVFHGRAPAQDPLTDYIGAGQRTPGVSRAQQRHLDFLYLLKDDKIKLRKALDLSPVQQVKLELYERRLSGLPARFVSDGSHSEESVAALNTPRMQLTRCADLGEAVADALSDKQIAIFEKSFRHRNLQPVEIQLEPKSILLVLRFGVGGWVSRVSLHSKVKVGDAKRNGPLWNLTKLLENFSDVSEAILDEDSAVQAIGVRALSTFSMNSVDRRQRARVGHSLLESASAKDLGYIREDDLMTALPKVVDVSHRRALLELSRSTSGIRLTGVVECLSRTAPEEAITLAASLVEDVQAFSAALDGFVKHGSDAEPQLLELQEALQGKQTALVQSALERIRGTDGALTVKKVPPLSLQSFFQSRPAKPKSLKGGSLPPAETGSEWLQNLRSDRFRDQHDALQKYESARESLHLEGLSAAEKAELVDLCGSRLKTEKNSIIGDGYGRILLDFADRDSVPLFEELTRSPADHQRLYGLAGLMKFSQEKAVEAGVRIEPTTFGIFTIVKAAKLVGPDSVPTLTALKGKLKKRSSQSWIDRALKELR